MSKVRNLTEITSIEDADLFYVVDYSAGTNGGRRITLANIKLSAGIGALKRGFLQYSNASLQTIGSTTYTDVSLSTSIDSFPNSLFTKLSATQFRCDYAGYVKISYRANAYPDTNDRGTGFRLAKNGTGQSHTIGEIWGKNVDTRSGMASGTYIFACAVNDYFTLQFASLESGVTSTLQSGEATVLVESYLVN
jgi:hypothetical protein